jgi:hypothetical protein
MANATVAARSELRLSLSKGSEHTRFGRGRAFGGGTG